MAFIPELATIQVPASREDMIKPVSGTEPVREISLVYGPLYARKRLLEAFTEVLFSHIPPHMKNKPDK